MIKVKSVRVEQAEGEVGKLVSGTFPTIAAGCAALREIARQCEPDMLGYLKTDVEIEWEDGTTQGFRADVNQNYDDTNLTAMLEGWAKRYVFDSKAQNLKRFLSPEQRAAWEKRAARILAGELELV